MSISGLKSIWYSFFFAMLSIQVVNAQTHFSYSEEVKQCYQQIMDLSLDDAQTRLHQIGSESNENLALVHLQNYHDFFQVYISDDPRVYKKLRSNRDSYLKKLQKGPKDSPWLLYTQADVRLQWALLKFRFGDYFSGFWDVKKAYALLKKNQKLFPDFIPNNKDLGILHALIGNVPDQYRWGVRNLIGLNGSIKQGKLEMEIAINDRNSPTDFLKKESVMLYSYLLLYLEKDASEAWQVLQNHSLDTKNHLLEAFTYASVAARSGYNDKALSVLSAAQKLPNWEQFPFLEFRLGNLLLRKLDPSARVHFNKFLTNYKGDKDLQASHLRLAWCALLEQDGNAYQKELLKIKSGGKNLSGRDQDAIYTKQLGFVPHPDLVKARLLFDGGYYLKSQKLIRSHQERDFKSIYEKLDWLYRKGRIEHQLKNYDIALQYYQEVVARGDQQTYYFSCNAALQTGLIYEQQQHWKQAKLYYQKCLEMEPDIYKNSLHLAAKAGLQRIEK